MGRSEAARRQAAGEKAPQIQFTQRPNNYKRDGGSRARVRTQKTSGLSGANAGMRLDMNNDQVRAGGTTYSKDGKTYTANGVTYDSASGQAINTATGKISSGGYSIDPKTSNRTDYTPGESRISRNVTKGDGSTGTQTGHPPAKPGDLDAFSRLLGSQYGVQFRGGFESNHLPTQSGYSVVDDVAMGGNTAEALAKKNGGFVEVDIDGSGIGPATVSRGEIAEGAQKGTSAVPDAGDQKRAVRVGRFDPRERGSQTGFNGADFSGAEPDDKSLTSGISARSRAFLDAPMGQGAMALRHAEASQGYIRQNGKNYAITGTGEDGKRTFQEFSDEGKNALQSDGNKTTSQEFLKNYMMGETDAKAAENPAVEAPVAVSYQPIDGSTPSTNLGGTEEFGQMSDQQQGMTAKGPLDAGGAYGDYIQGREPMMRFNQQSAPSLEDFRKQYGQ